MGISPIIDNFLYISAAKDTKNIDLMRKYNITHIISCAGTVAHPENYKIVIEHFEDEEDVNITEQIERVFWFIEKVKLIPNSRILVHCLAGKSRSVSLVLGYFLKCGIHSLAEIFYSVQSRRQEIRPNDGFMYQLLDMEYKIKGKISFNKMLKEWNSIVKQPPNSHMVRDLSVYRGHDPNSSKNLQIKLESIINEYFSIYLTKDILKSLLNKHLEETHQTKLYEYTFFSKQVQQYLSTNTNKANDFINTNKYYFIEWSDISKYLEKSIENLLLEI